MFVFSSIYSKNINLLKKDNMVFVLGNPSNRNDNQGNNLKIIAEEIYPLEGIRKKLSNNINIIINNNQKNNILQNINKISKNNQGKCNLILHFINSNNVQKILVRHYKVSHSEKFIYELRKILGEKNVWIN